MMTDKPTQDIAASQAAGSAVAVLAVLGNSLTNLVRSAAAGRSTKPILMFKSREGGTWIYGQKRTEVEEDSHWALNMTTLKHGYIAFSTDNQVVGEYLVPASQPKPILTELPDHGVPWQEQFSVDMKCTDGEDAGTEVVYKPTTQGGRNDFLELVDKVATRLCTGPSIHEDKVVPIVTLGRDSYQHQKFGRVWVPMLVITNWMTMEGPPPAAKAPPPEPAPAPRTGPAPAANEPRRRRTPTNAAA